MQLRTQWIRDTRRGKPHGLVRRSEQVSASSKARSRISCLAIALIGCWSLASAQPLARAEKASLRVLSDRTGYEAGSTARLAAVMTIEPGWHTNSHEPTFDYLIATSVRFEVPPGWLAAEIAYPEGEMKTFSFADQAISVYEGEVAIFGTLEIPADTIAGKFTIEVALTYQACDDRSCLPPVTTSQAVALAVGTLGQPVADSVFLGGQSSPASRSSGIVLMLALGFVGGLILNAMPCVLPVLSLKVLGLVKSAGKGRAQVIVGSLATTAGIVISFWALALGAILAKSAGAAIGWGIQFQEPVFVVVLTIIVLLFCLNLWGIFEVPLPARLASLAESGPKEGLPGHLASGLFTTLMATPCSAPFLGAAVGFALSQQAATILAVFTSIALGMALPYLALAAAPRAADLLPRPGPWMETLRIIMGFLLTGAAVWLLYVLAAQMSRERLAFVELALLAMTLFIWIRHQTTRRSAAQLLSLIAIAACMALSIWLATGITNASASTRAREETSGLISWVDFDRREAERLAAEGQLVFVDVTADWCFTCKVNERLVLETEEVAFSFEKHSVIPMKADWTNRSDLISRYLADHGRYGIPFYLLYRPGREPYLFGELLTKDGLIRVVEETAAATRSLEGRSPSSTSIVD